MHSPEVASLADRHRAAAPAGDTATVSGLMVRPFPTPGPALSTVMEQLHRATMEPPEDIEAAHDLSRMPRPWDPGTCSGHLRGELWEWLDQVATWINEQHLWNVTRPGIPECWPAHPHLVHDLALLACGRQHVSLALSPAPLEDWHRYGLPAFLERLRDRLGDGCQPGKHQPRPRHERDNTHAASPAQRQRNRCYDDDAKRASELAESSSCGRDTASNLHKSWQR